MLIGHLVKDQRSAAQKVGKLSAVVPGASLIRDIVENLLCCLLSQMGKRSKSDLSQPRARAPHLMVSASDTQTSSGESACWP